MVHSPIKPTLPGINVEVNGTSVAVLPGATVLQACEAAGIEIPRFCYHERLLVAGNCRMCLVEIAGSPKPQASCALPVSPNMKIFTNTPRVKKARESVMEFLLLNHPLDCPICDQGGECDRQDQSMVFGSDRSRMFETKRGVEDKDMGPLVKTVMTRCIHCTRCIRFASEIAGVADRGTSGRGRETEVGTYVSKVRKTELSGNLIDLCPVGALTSKPSAFVSRPWELESTDTVDAMDGFGASIRIQSRGTDVRRVQPRENDALNQAWLGDKSRFARDGATCQRIVQSYVAKVSSQSQKTLSPVPLTTAISHTLSRLTQSQHVQRVVSPTLDIETLASALNRANLLPSASISVRGNPSEPTFGESSSVDSHELMGLGMKSLAQADLCVLVGFNPRHEAPLRNLILRDAFLRDSLEVVSIGLPVDLTYPVNQLGSLDQLVDRVEGNHDRSVRLAQAKRPVILVGPSIAHRDDASTRTRSRRQLSHNRSVHGSVQSGWRTLNFYHPSASTTAALSMGRPGFNGWTDSSSKTALVRCGVGRADIIEAGYSLPNRSLFHGVVSFATHGDDRMSMFDAVFPRPVFYETLGHYMNTEGLVQSSYPSLGSRLPSSTRTELVHHVQSSSPSVSVSTPWASESVTSTYDDSTSLKGLKALSSRSGAYNTRVQPAVHDYYLEGHPLARFSVTMAKASRELSNNDNFLS